MLPDGTAKRVRSWRKLYDIDTLPRWERNIVIPIEGSLESLLVGSMLGDGRLVRQTNATYFTEGHCLAQMPYLEWKATQWGPWANPIRDISGKGPYPTVGFTTCAHASLNEWQEMFYADKRKGWKRLLPQIVDKVDAYALAVWYMDDGSAGWWPGITFGADDASRAVAWSIFDKFGLNPRWQLRVRTTGIFHMEREDTAHRFLDIIRPHVPACMAYKLGPFGFEGPQYQIRQKLPQAVLQGMAEAGVPLRVMSKRLGVGTSTILRRLETLGITHPRTIGRPHKDPEHGKEIRG
jgi:hypothetical protein